MIQRRKRPVPDREILLARIAAVLLIGIAIGVFVLFVRCVSSAGDCTAAFWLSNLMCLAGFVIIAAHLVAALSSGNPRKVFKRSNSTARAVVLDRKMKKREDVRLERLGGSRSDTLVSMGITLLYLFVVMFFPSTEYSYSVVIEFEASRSASSSEQVRLLVPTSKRFYERHPQGTPITVRYSNEDPAIVELKT